MTIRPARPTYCFEIPALVIGKRLTHNGLEYAVLNGHPNNVSVRWYNIRDVRRAPNG